MSAQPEEAAVREPVLAPLGARYSGAPAVIPPEADGVVRAMPVILRIERELPPRSALLEAAAQAALAVCVDPRAQGEWYESLAAWVDGRIRKIARRARGAHWAAVQELPGVTVEVDGAEARALLPGPVDAVPKTVSRLQIGGTDLPPDEPGPVPDAASLIVVNPAVDMTVGKAAAQVGHASMILGAVRGWTEAPRFAVRRDQELWEALLAREDVVCVRDAGFTEVDPGTITCAAVPAR
ncbi:aminoacyl-tRNA hydrolase [Pseudonocardia yuanmonensis]|uniref:Aminoacyl-tRNA hydrolase n=1 Tax=Pseudonocardia yuanmonensis TaxID=1095914 RepID=A0ABP8W957_9PSEU